MTNWTYRTFRAKREALNLTVDECAAMLGMSQQHVRRLQIKPGKSAHRPVSDTVARLMQAYLDGYRPADWPKAKS